MKIGLRKPSLKKSIKARTTGRAKRAIKRKVIPGYGRKGMGWLRDPKRAAYNAVYRRTTVGLGDVLKMFKCPPRPRAPDRGRPGGGAPPARPACLRRRPAPPPTSHRPANASTRRTASGCSDAAAIDAASCRTCARSASTSAPRASAFVGP